MKGRTEGLTTLYQMIMRGIPPHQRVFGRRSHFSVSLLLLAFINNVSLKTPPWTQPTLGGGVIPFMTRQGEVEALTCMGPDTSLLVQQLDG